MTWWQHLPEALDPIALTVGFFSVSWYALFFLGGWATALLFCLWRGRKGEMVGYSQETILDLFILIFFGALIGGRIGYVLFYNLDAFMRAPLSIFLPYDFARGIWIGISGMSYHGGLIGAVIALLYFSRKKRASFWVAADFMALAAPVATFFGRLGNFFNLELYGRITERPWGMVFPGALPQGALRHPSELYEAILEGIVLFIILVLMRRRMPFPGALACLYLALYAIFRFIAEFFREPDAQLGFFFALPVGGFTLGQIFSVGMLAGAALIFRWLRRRNRATIIQKQ